MVEVVLPTPPFWLHIAMILAGPCDAVPMVLECAGADGRWDRGPCCRSAPSRWCPLESRRWARRRPVIVVRWAGDSRSRNGPRPESASPEWPHVQCSGVRCLWQMAEVCPRAVLPLFCVLRASSKRNRCRRVVERMPFRSRNATASLPHERYRLDAVLRGRTRISGVLRSPRAGMAHRPRPPRNAPTVTSV